MREHLFKMFFSCGFVGATYVLRKLALCDTSYRIYFLILDLLILF